MSLVLPGVAACHSRQLPVAHNQVQLRITYMLSISTRGTAGDVFTLAYFCVWCCPGWLQAITEHGLYQRTAESIPEDAWGQGMVTLVGDAAHTAYVDGTGLALSLGEAVRADAARKCLQFMPGMWSCGVCGVQRAVLPCMLGSFCAGRVCNCRTWCQLL